MLSGQSWVQMTTSPLKRWGQLPSLSFARRVKMHVRVHLEVITEEWKPWLIHSRTRYLYPDASWASLSQDKRARGVLPSKAQEDGTCKTRGSDAQRWILHSGSAILRNWISDISAFLRLTLSLFPLKKLLFILQHTDNRFPTHSLLPLASYHATVWY